MLSRSIEFFREVDENDLSSYASYDIQEHLTNISTIPTDMQNKIAVLEKSDSATNNANITKTISFIKASFAQLNDDLIQYKIQQVKDKLKNIIQEENKVESGQNENTGSNAQSQIKIIHLEKHHEILKKRKEELNEIKITTGQIKDLTEEFKKEVFDQGDLIDQIEKDITEVQENAKKADGEIVAAKKHSETNKKCIVCVGVIGFIVGIIITFCIIYLKFFK